jgi:protein-arginine kinase activator protein McsA
MTDESITCPECGMTSYNPNDVAEGYCGNCHAFTSTTAMTPIIAAVKSIVEEDS